MAPDSIDIWLGAYSKCMAGLGKVWIYQWCFDFYTDVVHLFVAGGAVVVVDMSQNPTFQPFGDSINSTIAQD